MKKIIIFTMLAVSLNAQTFINCPQVMVKDTVYLRTQTTQDFYPNSKNSFGVDVTYVGPIDFQIIPCIASGSDSLTIEVYGILKTLDSRTSAWVTTYVDSHNVVTNLDIDGLPHVYAIDPLWADFPVYDGLRFIIKKNGSDTDSDSLFTRIRIWPQGGNP